MHVRTTAPSRRAVAVAASLLAATTALTVTDAYGAGRPPTGASGSERSGASGAAPEARGAYDARRGSGSTAQARALRTAAKAAARPATRTLTRSLGDQALVDIDGTTGTPRMVARLDGFLTRPSSAPARRVAMRYVVRHRAALGLTRADLRTFRMRRDYRDVAGVHHLSWVQVIDGTEVFGNGLTASVTRNGRLLTLGGSPVSGAQAAPAGTRSLGTKKAAIRAARRDLGERSARPGARDSARKMLFVTRSGTHLGWRTIVLSAASPTMSVLDARTGRLLFRRSLSDDASARDRDSRGLAYRYFPGASAGGTARPVNYTARGWLSPRARILAGNNSHTFSDVNDDNLVQRSEEVPSSSPHRWNYRLQPFHLADVSFCDNPYPCSWDPNTPFSWQVNRKQNASQVFFYVNNWHDHLLRRPIGFTEAAGNFQVRNRTGKGTGGDAVFTQTDDGANTGTGDLAGLPDGSHIDNANMSTPPDGEAPTMQMYLQHQPGTTYPDGDPFAPTNVGDEADTVYHEYTHGLSNRLVVDAGGNSTLGEVQAGSMGEAWSDWYAMDYLVGRGYQADQADDADVVLFQYDGEGVFLDRTEPIDCKVGSDASRCTGGTTGHTGGYTYADYGNVVGGPEVHGDGEIWSQTLWDLRDALGSRVTETLVTRAMELSPSDPSFLDERNAILVADTARFGGRHHDAIWEVFAHRGMGYFAGSLGGEDPVPGADFSTPPAGDATGTITGTVTDADSGAPVEGATVTLAFQGGDTTANPSAVTGADGTYSLGPVPVGTYPKLVLSGAGYEPSTQSVTVTEGEATVDATLRKDWAAASGGATISDFSGPDFSPACGPEQAIDLSQATGWGSTTGDDDGTPTNVFVPKFITVDLQQPVDISAFGVDPSATCGDGGSASLGQFTIETSADGTAWTTAQAGTFTVDDRGQVNELAPTAGADGVRFVRLTMLGNQTPDFATNCPDGAFSGCSFTDLTELEVYGTASP